MAVDKKRGLLVVFEGCDRSGKSSQCQIVLDRLKEKELNAQFMRFPGSALLTRPNYHNWNND
jgi:dTMP kinase